MVRQYEVTKSWELGTPSSADEFVIDDQVDLALLLSQRLQRQVRQGRSFRLHSVKASLKPAGGNHDIGVAVTGQVAFCPATKNSVKGWQHAFHVWKKQKALRVGAFGHIVKYDDFEVAFDENTITSRTSTVFAEGLNDGDTESVTIYGESNDGFGTNMVTLEDIYESAQTTSGNLGPSRFPLDNAQVKASKFTQQFPDSRSVPFAAHLSAVSADPGFDSGATVSQHTTYVKDGATLAGVLRVYATMLPENTLDHIQDAMKLTLTFCVSMGVPLAKTKRSSGRRSRLSRTYGGKRRSARMKKGTYWRRYRKG